MEGIVKVACVQAEPVPFDKAATIEKIEGLAAEVAGEGARLALFPETFIPAYPSNRWVRFLAGGGSPEQGDGRATFARLAQESVEIPGPDSERLGEIARLNKLWLAVGVNEPIERGTIYNALLVYSPEGELALHHRKLMPTNHERLVWGLGDSRGLRDDRHRHRQDRRPDLLGEPDAARALRALPGRSRGLSRADRRRLGASGTTRCGTSPAKPARSC